MNTELSVLDLLNVSSDRRMEERLSSLGDSCFAKLQRLPDGESKTVLVRDISMKGIGIIAAHCDDWTIDCKVRIHYCSLELEGTIVNMRDTVDEHSLIGIRFDKPQAPKRTQLEAAV